MEPQWLKMVRWRRLGKGEKRKRNGRKESPLPQIALNKAEVVCVTVGDYIVISTRTE